MNYKNILNIPFSTKEKAEMAINNLNMEYGDWKWNETSEKKLSIYTKRNYVGYFIEEIDNKNYNPSIASNLSLYWSID